jgi:hypothetical protein
MAEAIAVCRVFAISGVSAQARVEMDRQREIAGGSEQGWTLFALSLRVWHKPQGIYLFCCMCDIIALSNMKSLFANQSCD